MATHIHTHNRIKGFQCEDCARLLYQYTDQQKHENTHAFELSYPTTHQALPQETNYNVKCEVCGNTLTHIDSLERHKLTHKEDEPASDSLVEFHIGPHKSMSSENGPVPPNLARAKLVGDSSHSYPSPASKSDSCGESFFFRC